MSMLTDAMKRGLYEDVIIGPAISPAEAKARGLSIDNPVGLALEELYTKHVTENPEVQAWRRWTADKVGIPQWIQDRDEMYAKEAEKRRSLFEKGMPDWRGLADTSPITAEFFNNDDVMASAYDDAEALAAKEMEIRRAGAVVSALRGKLSRGGYGRMAAAAAMKKMPKVYGPDDDPKKAKISPIDAQMYLEAARAEKRRAGDVPDKASLPAVDEAGKKALAAAGRDFDFVNDFIMGTSWGKGAAAGYEMTSIADEATDLFVGEVGFGRKDEARWVELEKRLLALDRDKPDGWLSGMLYETGKFFGQQARGAWKTGAMSAAGGALGAYAASLGAALPSSAYFSMEAGSLMGAGTAAAAVVGSAPVLPPVAAAAFTAAAAWWLGAKLGVFWQSAKTEAGLDLIERRMMTDEEGNHLSNLSIGLGSMAVGAVNGALELFEWETAGRPFVSMARRTMGKEALSAVSAAVTRRLAKLPVAAKIAGLAAKDWGLNVFSESMTEVMQDLVPITIDEMQKHYLLSDFDRRTLGEINAQLTETFTSSLYSFALISALGPTGAFIRSKGGDYNAELARRELEAQETLRLNRTLDTFAERMLATKLFKRFPGMSEAHTEEILKDADLSRAYVPASTVEKLFQEARKDPGNITKASDYTTAKEWAEDAFGVSAADYDESMETGHRMEIAAARVFEAAGENDAVMEELRRNMSWTADGMTVAEAEEAKKNIDELRRQDFFKLKPIFDTEEREERSARVIYESARMQLENAGQDAETASNWAWMKARMYIQLARMYSDAMPKEAEKAAKKAGRELGRFMPEDIERMFPMVIETGEDGTLKGVTFRDDSMTALAQPMNADVDIKQKIIGTIVQPKLSLEEARRVKKNEDKKAFAKGIAGIYNNENTGWDISLSIDNVSHAVSSALKSPFGFENAVNILEALPQIVQRAKLIETHPDRHKDKQVKNIHRMYASVRMAGTDKKTHTYTIKLTVKEMDGSYAAEVEGIYRAYDTNVVKEVTEEISDVKRGLLPHEEAPIRNTPDTYEITIEDMLRGVKDNDGISYLQSAWHGSPYDTAVNILETYYQENWKANAAEIKNTILKQVAFPVERDTAVIPEELRRDYRNGVAGTNRNLKYLLASILPQVVSTKAVGDVLISNSSIKNDLRHSRGGMKLDSLTVIDKLLSDAVKIGEEKLVKGKENVTTHILARKATWAIKKDPQENHAAEDTKNDLEEKMEYVVVMAVNEDRNGKLFYDHEMTEIVDLDLLSSGAGQEGWQTGHKEKAHRGLINILAEDIWLGKANDENNYLKQKARGSITLPAYDGAPVRITLGKGADKSTFTHELAHLYLWHLKRLAAFDAVQNRASWTGPAARWNNDLRIVSGWWGDQAEDIARQAAAYVAEENKGTLSAAGFRQWLASGMETESEAGKAYSRSAQEYFARGFEKYLAEGKAPSKELLSVFRRFKKWLCEIYRSLTELDVELSEEIRGVYDRMLATEEAVERLRASRELDDVLSAMLPEGDEESMGDPYDFGDDPYEDAKERVLSGLLDRLTPERRKAMADYAEDIRPEITRAVAQDPGYRAIAMLEENPNLRLSADAVLDEFGENVVSAMPEGTLAENPGEGMTDLTVAARSLGFKSARDMIDAVAGRRGTSEEIDARVRAAVEAEFADEASSPEAMDAAAEAALYETDDAGERIAAEAEADLAAAEAEVKAAEESEAAEEAAAEAEPEFADDEEARAYHEAYRDIFEADEAAKAEREDPRSRKNVIAWIRRSGGLNYKAVVAAVGQEQARELLQKVGPGLFRKDATLGLDTAAQELSGMGAVFESDEELFKLLMKDPVALSPIELAASEARKETIREFKEGYKALRDNLRSEVQEEKKEGREKLSALREKLKEQYKERTKKLRDKYQQMTERQRAEFEGRKQRERDRRNAARMKKALEKQIKKSANKNESAKAARIATQNAASAMTVQQLYDVSGWVRTEKDSRAAADKALRAHDENGYRAAKRRELYAHEMVRSMYRARARAEYIRKKLSEYQGRGQKRTFGMTPEYLRQLDAMLSRLILDRQQKAADVLGLTREQMTEPAKPLTEFLKEQADDGVPLMIPDWMLGNTSRRYESLVMYELEEAYKAARNMIQAGRDDNKTIARNKNIELYDIDNQVYERAQKYYGDKKKIERDPKLVVAREETKFVPAFLADLDTAEAMCRALDGYEDFGPMQDFVFRPIREAVSREVAELDRVFGRFRDLKARVYGNEFKVDVKKRDIGVPEYIRKTDPQTGKPYYVKSGQNSLFTKENIICAAFNMGNADNIARLKDGWGWTDQDIEKIKEQMTEKDWQYVQGVWDLLEEMWPQIRKVHELMTGTTLEKVETQKVATKFGELRGGYYPIVTDLRYSERAAAQSEHEEVMASAPLDHMQRHGKSGHRKARAENVPGRPPLLSFSVLDNHIANVIHDYELSPVVRDVRKILRRDTVSSVIKSVLGQRGYTNFNHWLNDIAANTKNNTLTRGPGDKFIQGLKSNTAMYALGANLGGALMQPLGYFPLAHRIGFANTALAIMDWLSHPQETFDFCREHSAFMREQLQNGNSEVRKLRQNWTTNDHGISKAADMMLSIYPMLQNMCNAPGWVRCYKIGLKKYGTEAKAVAYADSIIRQTQSASTIADLSSFERSGTVGQMMTMFYSWFRVMYQMQNEAIRKVKYEHGLFNKTKDLASYTLYVLIAQSVAEALLRRSGPDPDDDDPYKWAKWTAGRLLLAPLSTVPVAREVGNFFDSNFKYGVTLSPVQSSFDSIVRVLATIWNQGGKIFSEDDIEWGKTAEAGAILAGYTLGVPNRAMIRAAKAFLAYFNEDEAIPWMYLLLGGGYRPKD